MKRKDHVLSGRVVVPGTYVRLADVKGLRDPMLVSYADQVGQVMNRPDQAGRINVRFTAGEYKDIFFHFRIHPHRLEVVMVSL